MPYVSTFPLFKTSQIKKKLSENSNHNWRELWVWPSGSFMTPVSFTALSTMINFVKLNAWNIDDRTLWLEWTELPGVHKDLSISLCPKNTPQKFCRLRVENFWRTLHIHGGEGKDQFVKFLINANFVECRTSRFPWKNMRLVRVIRVDFNKRSVTTQYVEIAIIGD